MDKKKLDEFMKKTMKENNPDLKVPKKSGAPVKSQEEELNYLVKEGSILENSIEKLKELFPSIVTEGKIDFDALRKLLKDDIEDSPEKFGLNFYGKKEAYNFINQPSLGTLKQGLYTTDKNSENMIITGENAEVLKILNKSYRNKIKMIYIDPPYNTGSNFIYHDDFKENLQNYLRMTGQKDEQGKSYQKNPETNGRFHSDWLKFMYSRLYLARELLRDDGVIFISIDDHEVANLKLLCNEIFGEEFVDTIVWRKSGVGRDGKMKNTATFRKDHEYIIVCFKKDLFLNKSYEKPNYENDYKNPDNDPRGVFKAGSISKKEEASNMKHPNYYTVISPTGKAYTRQFDISQENFQNLNNDNRIYWGKNRDSVPQQKIFIDEKRTVTTSSYWNYINMSIEAFGEFDSCIDNSTMTTTRGGNDLQLFFNNLSKISEMFRAKPVELIKKLLIIGSNANDIILDFFAGSGTTAHAVMELNKERALEGKEGNIQYILVQIPEEINKDTEAYKAGYKTIDQITCERVKRAGAKIQKELEETLNPPRLDLGFRHLELAETHFPKEVHSIQEEIILDTQLKDLSGVKKEDLLLEILIR